ncbi:coiled-coil domain-containing protein [Wolbachia endosymbiont (group B) of Sphaerophoria taeniata]|uniref:hypothetical protein n=1 Tax=Wolbachia endosymbiont (group B) of Sphaerophoria taeniata TaxID=2954058 RepID=UPI0022201D73|nr:hypothetical protein [Wolbachia endosymbiont (group B) of Sphaerophoria taeniata]
MLNANNKVNYEPSIKQKEKKYSLSTVLAWLYLKTIGRMLPEKWNQWAKNILYYNKIIADNGVQTDALKAAYQSVQVSEVAAKDIEIQTEFAETEDKNKELNEELEGVSQALEAFIGLCNNQAQQIGSLQSGNDFLGEKNRELKSKLAELEKSYKELKAIAQERGEEFLAQFKEKSEEILHLQKELTERSKEFANKIEMLSAEIEKKDKKIRSLTELNKALEQKEKEMENKKNEQQQIIIEEEKRIREKDNLIKSFHENKDINETVRKENEKLRVQKTELENEVSKLKDESDAKIKQLENQLKEKQAEFKQAEEKILNLEKKLESAQQQLVQEKTNLKDELKDSSSKLNAAEIKKKELEDEVNELKEKAKGKDAEVENLKQQLEKEKTNLNTIEKEKKELESEVDKLQEKSQKLEESNVEIKKQKADLEGKLKSSQGENKKLQKQVEHPSAKKTENITTFSTRNNKEIPNQSLTSKDKQTEVSRPESGQQKLKNELKDASKKPEDINKETKALDAKSMLSTTKSITKSTFSKVKNKLLGNEDLNNFLSKENKELKKSFPELEGKHFCHIVLKKTIQSLLCQNSYKFKSDKLLALLKENLVKSGKAIIETKVNTVVEKVGKKHSIEQVIFVQECAKGLYLNEEDSQAIISSLMEFLAHKNNSNNDSVKKFVVQKLTEAEMKCFSDKIQGLQLASSIRDKFLSPDQKMCVQTSEENNEYQLTKKAKKEYKLTPNSSMSHTNSTPVSVKQEAKSR